MFHPGILWCGAQDRNSAYFSSHNAFPVDVPDQDSFVSVEPVLLFTLDRELDREWLVVCISEASCQTPFLGWVLAHILVFFGVTELFVFRSPLLGTC